MAGKDANKGVLSSHPTQVAERGQEDESNALFANSMCGCK